MMLGRYQPFHKGHIELFKKALEKTGHVTIMVRDCYDENNPFGKLTELRFRQMFKNIFKKKEKEEKLNDKNILIIANCMGLISLFLYRYSIAQ